MTINFCYTPSANEVVDKVVTTKYTHSATVKDDTNVQTPTFIIDYTPIDNINYIYVPLWHRYYYITDVVAINGKHLAINCKCDVLKSFASYIRQNRAIIDKQQYDEKTSKYIDDNSYVLQCRDAVQSITFPTGFTSSNSILITAGG